MRTVIEGSVSQDTNGPFVGNSLMRFHSRDLLTEFVGKHVRVTIEVLPDPDEDCPPATDADGRKASDNKPW